MIYYQYLSRIGQFIIQKYLINIVTYKTGRKLTGGHRNKRIPIFISDKIYFNELCVKNELIIIKEGDT